MTIDREELRRLCEAATPGPWTLDPCDGEFGFVRSGIVWTAQNDSAAFSGTDFIQAKTEEDAAFIAAARAAVPALLDALEAAEARERRLREAVTKCADRFGEYERAHLDAGKMDKAARNGEMRKMCENALAETAKTAYFPVVYDGEERVGSVSRHPDCKPTSHHGGK